nr:hypothetical protein [Tanacetum cinerariifolium]
MLLKDGHICSNEFDEKVQRAYMFYEECISIGFDNPVRGLGIEDGLDGTEGGYQRRCLAPQLLCSSAYLVWGCYSRGPAISGLVTYW